jgi:hypothetical protein
MDYTRIRRWRVLLDGTDRRYIVMKESMEKIKNNNRYYRSRV